MKRLIPILLCVAAAGCARISDLTSDAFAQGNVGPERFKLDDRACTHDAEVQRSFEVRGISAENADKHRIFNRVYAACMRANGYKERGGLGYFQIPYDL